MNKKIVIILIFFTVCLLMSSPVCAKKKVKVKISTEEYPLNNKGFIIIKLVDSQNKSIKSNAKINYTVTDKNGNYKWVCKSYDGEIKLKYDAGRYKVNVKFFGDSNYKKTEKTKRVNVKTATLNPYTYYDDHNWGLNQEIDDYFDYNYWSEEIYDDVDDPENEAWDI